MHEKVFRRAVEDGGLNGYMFEQINIREQVSWVHHDMEEATRKAIELVRAGVAKVVRNQPLSSSTIPVTRRALVIGGGIAGMQAALPVAISNMRAELCVEVFERACRNDGADGMILHSDRGSQFTSYAFREALKNIGQFKA